MTVSIIADERRVSDRDLIAQQPRESLRFFLRDHERVFDVVSHDLLPARVRESAEDAHFCRRPITIRPQNPTAINPLGSQSLDERVAGGVVAEDGDWKRESAERKNIV